MKFIKPFQSSQCQVVSVAKVTIEFAQAFAVSEIPSHHVRLRARFGNALEINLNFSWHTSTCMSLVGEQVGF